MSGGKSETALPELLGAKPDNYAGDVSPQEAWNVLSKNSDAVLVDVRTLPEWNFVGASDLSSISKEPVFEEWQCYPSMKVNEKFVADVSAKIGGKDTPILFICRSGARSRAAAIAFTAQGSRVTSMMRVTAVIVMVGRWRDFPGSRADPSFVQAGRTLFRFGQFV